MTSVVGFLQSCPTCGRRSRIPVQFLGNRIRCQHCHAEFVADPNLTAQDSDPRLLMQRAERLLEPRLEVL